MHKVLIISYFFPPCNLAASNRAYGWAKYLSDYDYYPIIVTRNWDINISVPSDIHISTGKNIKHEKNKNYEVFYLPFKAGIKDRIFNKLSNSPLHFISKLLTFIELILRNFTNSIISYNNIYKFCDKYLSENKDVNILIVTANPFILFRFGYLLKKKHKISWLADYRDDWNTSELLENKGFFYSHISKLEKLSERKWVKTAECISSVSEHYCNKISNFVNKKSYILNNGFFEEEFDLYNNITLFDKFTITFNGTLYQSQPIEIFSEAIKKLINKYEFKISIQLYFPGLAFNKIQETRVLNLFKGYESFVNITSRISRSEILNIQARSHLLLMIAHKNITGVPSSKLYEYIALKKPVLLCPSDNDIIEKILSDVNLGLYANSEDEACAILGKAYEAYTRNDNIIKEIFKSKEILKYSRRIIANKLASILNKFIYKK